jgi:predicted kinase
MKYFYMMVGMPACGKSTWVSNNYHDGIFISSDAFIELEAFNRRKTYDEVFTDVIDTATKQFFAALKSALDQGMPKVLVDRTNLGVKSRKKILDLVPKDYKKIAIVVQCSVTTQDARLLSRPGKSIPFKIIQNMRNDFKLPTLDEGFDDVVMINTDKDKND